MSKEMLMAVDAAANEKGVARGVIFEAMEAALAWFDATHGRQRIACMIDEGHAASDALAGKLGFVRYGTFQPDGGAAPLVLYERL